MALVERTNAREHSVETSAGTLTSMLWRRLDVPGHDCATCAVTADGTEIGGMAVFEEDGPTALHYTVRCDRSWETTEAHVRGWRGTRAVDLRLRREDGHWMLNDAPCPAVDGCVDLDLSFTPATNLFPLRRLDLAIGQAAELRSAWLEWPAARLSPLVQRYARRSPTEYDYEADLTGTSRFFAVLRVDPRGWVRDYAGLWRAEAVA